MQIFLDPEAIKIKQNQLLQTLESWGPTFSISVEIKITSFQAQEAGHWGEIFRLTSRPGDCCLNGQRVPVVFLSMLCFYCSCYGISNQFNAVLFQSQTPEVFTSLQLLGVMRTKSFILMVQKSTLGTKWSCHKRKLGYFTHYHQINFSLINFQESHFFQVHLNGELKVNELNLNPQRFENVQVFASANFYWAAYAYIKNLHFDTNPDGENF